MTQREIRRRSHCKHREQRNAASRLYRQQNRERMHRLYRARQLARYGLTLDDYDRMVTEQNGVCAICGRPETQLNNHGSVQKLSVDHNHRTNVVRGLLCSDCNTSIGKMLDSPELLRKAAQYVEKAETKPVLTV